MKRFLLASLMAAASLVSLAHAADVTVPGDGLIATRQAGFDLQNGAMAAMKATIDGGASVKPMADSAKGLAAWGAAIPLMFPKGTDSGHNTKARAEIWSDSAGFQKAAADFTAAANKLAAAAQADDKTAFAAAFKDTGAACGACHRQFRARS